MSDVAVKLAMIDRTGAALGENKAFFFGADPKSFGETLTTAVVSEGGRKGIFG